MDISNARQILICYKNLYYILYETVLILFLNFVILKNVYILYNFVRTIFLDER